MMGMKKLLISPLLSPCPGSSEAVPSSVEDTRSIGAGLAGKMGLGGDFLKKNFAFGDPIFSDHKIGEKDLDTK